MKASFHKGCSCHHCKAGRNHYKRNLNERKFRQKSRIQICQFLKGTKDDVEIYPISSPYTD